MYHKSVSHQPFLERERVGEKERKRDRQRENKKGIKSTQIHKENFIILTLKVRCGSYWNNFFGEPLLSGSRFELEEEDFFCDEISNHHTHVHHTSTLVKHQYHQK